MKFDTQRRAINDFSSSRFDNYFAIRDIMQRKANLDPNYKPKVKKRSPEII